MRQDLSAIVKYDSKVTKEWWGIIHRILEARIMADAIIQML